MRPQKRKQIVGVNRLVVHLEIIAEKIGGVAHLRCGKVP